MRNNYNNKCITGYDDINIAFMHQSNKSEEKNYTYILMQSYMEYQKVSISKAIEWIDILS